MSIAPSHSRFVSIRPSLHMIFTTKTSLLLLCCLIVCLGALPVTSRPNGYPGRFSKSTEGCGSCHGLADPYKSVSVTVDSAHSTTIMRAGERRTFTIIAQHQTAKVAGINIAFTGEASGIDPVGTIDGNNASDLRETQSQLVHRSPHPMDGTASFTFGWTAPAEPGTYYLQAVVMAGNGNGSDGDGDEWNWLEPVTITVTPATDVDELVPSSFEEISSVVGGLPLALLQGTSLAVLTVYSLDGAVVYHSENEGGYYQSPLPMVLPKGLYLCVITDLRRQTRVIRLML